MDSGLRTRLACTQVAAAAARVECAALRRMFYLVVVFDVRSTRDYGDFKLQIVIYCTMCCIVRRMKACLNRMLMLRVRVHSENARPTTSLFGCALCARGTPLQRRGVVPAAVARQKRITARREARVSVRRILRFVLCCC